MRYAQYDLTPARRDRGLALRTRFSMLNKKKDLISFKMFGEQAPEKLAIICGDMCKLYSNTET